MVKQEVYEILGKVRCLPDDQASILLAYLSLHFFMDCFFRAMISHSKVISQIFSKCKLTPILLIYQILILLIYVLLCEYILNHFNCNNISYSIHVALIKDNSRFVIHGYKFYMRWDMSSQSWYVNLFVPNTNNCYFF